MECQKCLDENKKSISEKGYGYGYIGSSINCVRHNIQTEQKWSNNFYEKSKRTNLNRSI